MVLGEIQHADLTSGRFDAPSKAAAKSDRYIPSRSCVSDVGKLKMSENTKPANEYEELLVENMLGPQANTDKVLAYTVRPPKPEANDSLKVRWQSGADNVNFQCEGGDDDRIADFDLKLMQIESEHMEIPEQQYKVVAKLPSAEFQRICRDLKEFGETMHVKASKEGITFSVKGDVGAGNVMLKPREAEKPEDKVTLTVHEPVTATFALRYLVNFSKAAPLCGSVELGLGPDAPLLVKYDLENAENGYMQFYLAPKIDE